jgi:hypothetical protein
VSQVVSHCVVARACHCVYMESCQPKLNRNQFNLNREKMPYLTGPRSIGRYQLKFVLYGGEAVPTEIAEVGSKKCLDVLLVRCKYKFTPKQGVFICDRTAVDSALD